MVYKELIPNLRVFGKKECVGDESMMSFLLLFFTLLCSILLFPFFLFSQKSSLEDVWLAALRP